MYFMCVINFEILSGAKCVIDVIIRNRLRFNRAKYTL